MAAKKKVESIIPLELLGHEGYDLGEYIEKMWTLYYSQISNSTEIKGAIEQLFEQLTIVVPEVIHSGIIDFNRKQLSGLATIFIGLRWIEKCRRQLRCDKCKNTPYSFGKHAKAISFRDGCTILSPKASKRYAKLENKDELSEIDNWMESGIAPMGHIIGISPTGGWIIRSKINSDRGRIYFTPFDIDGDKMMFIHDFFVDHRDFDVNQHRWGEMEGNVEIIGERWDNSFPQYADNSSPQYVYDEINFSSIEEFEVWLEDICSCAYLREKATLINETINADLVFHKLRLIHNNLEGTHPDMSGRELSLIRYCIELEAHHYSPSMMEEIMHNLGSILQGKWFEIMEKVKGPTFFHPSINSLGKYEGAKMPVVFACMARMEEVRSNPHEHPSGEWIKGSRRSSKSADAAANIIKEKFEWALSFELPDILLRNPDDELLIYKIGKAFDELKSDIEEELVEEVHQKSPYITKRNKRSIQHVERWSYERIHKLEAFISEYNDFEDTIDEHFSRKQFNKLLNMRNNALRLSADISYRQSSHDSSKIQNLEKKLVRIIGDLSINNPFSSQKNSLQNHYETLFTQIRQSDDPNEYLAMLRPRSGDAFSDIPYLDMAYVSLLRKESAAGRFEGLSMFDDYVLNEPEFSDESFARILLSKAGKMIPLSESGKKEKGNKTFSRTNKVSRLGIYSRIIDRWNSSMNSSRMSSSDFVSITRKPFLPTLARLAHPIRVNLHEKAKIDESPDGLHLHILLHRYFALIVEIDKLHPKISRQSRGYTPSKFSSFSLLVSVELAILHYVAHHITPNLDESNYILKRTLKEIPNVTGTFEQFILDYPLEKQINYSSEQMRFQASEFVDKKDLFIRRNRIDVTQHVSDNVSYRQKDISPKSLYNHLEIYSSLRRSRSPINSEIKSYLNNKNPNAEDLFSIIQELKGEYPRMFR
jgi:hypothetical protein